MQSNSLAEEESCLQMETVIQVKSGPTLATTKTLSKPWV